MNTKIKEKLENEMDRLSRINDLLEKNIEANKLTFESEQRIINNVKAMCEIAMTIY